MTSFIQLLDLSNDDRNNIKNILDKIETKISFTMEYSFEIQPFIACSLPVKNINDAIFVGITMPSTYFRTKDVEVNLPDWTDKIPNINQIKVCIKGIIEALQINNLPCFELNTG